MKFNLTAKVLFTTLALCGVGAPAIAQYSGGYPAPAPAPGAYPNYPASAPAPTYRPPAPKKATAFVCGRVGNYPATLVQVNGRTMQQPLIVFQTATDYLSPQERCNSVSQRMTAAVAQNGGRLSNLLLTTGKVDRQAVICFVNTSETCNRDNVILTLVRRENAKDPGKVLARIVKFARDGGGRNVLENGGIEGGEEEIVPTAISLEEIVNEIANESGGLESGGVDPSYNQTPTNSAPDPGAGTGGGGI